MIWGVGWKHCSFWRINTIRIKLKPFKDWTELIHRLNVKDNSLWSWNSCLYKMLKRLRIKVRPSMFSYKNKWMNYLLNSIIQNLYWEKTKLRFNIMQTDSPSYKNIYWLISHQLVNYKLKLSRWRKIFHRLILF